MSTKTMRKRLALATVVAIGAGVLSATAANAANTLVASTVIGTGNLNVATPATGVTNPVSVANVLNIASKLSTNGALNTTGTFSATATNDTSIGLLSVGDLAGNSSPVAGTTSTATLLSSGKIVVYTTNSTNQAVLLTVTGGTISANAGATAFARDSTSMAANTLNAGLSAAIAPNAGATSMTIRLYASNDSSATAAGMLSGANTGTMTGQIQVTVASASTSGTVSAAKSSIYYAPNGNVAQNLAADNTAAFAANYLNTSVPWNVTNFASINTKDAYGNSITSITGLLTATATNGAYVALAGTGAATAGTQSTAFLTGYTPDGAALAVSDPTSAPLTTTVTIAYNGVTIGTKSFTFTGVVTKVVLGAAAHIQKLSHTAAANFKGATITYYDAAGNAILPVSGDAAYPTSGFAVAASSGRTTVIQSIVPTSTATGYIDWTCGTTASTDNAIVQYVNIDGSVVTSNATPVSCAGAATTYTAAFDKAIYNPGDLATLSVTFKDSNGNLAADYLTSTYTDGAYFVNYNSSTNPIVGVAGGTLAAAPAQTTLTANGVATFTVLTGVTEGTYQTTVNVGTPANASLIQSTPALAGYTLKGQGTSLNDVLKGIVSLIASINKQIAALAKLVTKK